MTKRDRWLVPALERAADSRDLVTLDTLIVATGQSEGAVRASLRRLVQSRYLLEFGDRSCSVLLLPTRVDTPLVIEGGWR